MHQGEGANGGPNAIAEEEVDQHKDCDKYGHTLGIADVHAPIKEGRFTFEFQATYLAVFGHLAQFLQGERTSVCEQVRTVAARTLQPKERCTGVFFFIRYKRVRRSALVPSYICRVVSLNKVTLDFTDKTLFNEIGFLITREDRIGLVGRNGAGKSTLLKVLAREQEIDKGEVAVQSGCSIGYLPQELDLLDRYSLMGEMEQAMPEIVELEQQLAYINSEMSERSDYESEAYMQLIQDLNDHTERYGMLGGYTFRAEIEKILKGLGFKAADFEVLTLHSQGGWRMRGTGGGGWSARPFAAR